MHLGMFDDLWSAASLVPAAREDGMDVYLVGNRNCPPFVRGEDCFCKMCMHTGYEKRYSVLTNAVQRLSMHTEYDQSQCLDPCCRIARHAH